MSLWTSWSNPYILHTSCQYQTSWKSFTSFVRRLDPDKMLAVVPAFTRYPFNQRRFFLTYKTALAKTLLWAFDINLSTLLFMGFYRALQNIRPSRIPSTQEWNLDKVLLLLISPDFTVEPSLLNLTMKTIFLLSLATGDRLSEVHAIRRGDPWNKCPLIWLSVVYTRFVVPR